MELSDIDTTNNINFICPSNYYSNSKFNKQKPTIVLFKSNDLYQPIIGYELQKTTIILTKIFKTWDDSNYKPLIDTFSIIENIINTKCKPYPSLPNIYKFSKNKNVETCIEILKKHNYTIGNLYMNYNNKIIALDAILDGESIYLPCFPSTINISKYNYNIKWVDEYQEQSYEYTIDMLNKIYINTEKTIEAKPIIKVTEDNVIVGIITQTDQFVPVALTDIIPDDLKQLETSNYNNIDEKLLTNKSKDQERIRYIKNIDLESQFYETFRNIVRTQLNADINHPTKTKINDILKDSNIKYFKKLQQIETLLRELVADKIEFTLLSDTILNKIDTIINCNTVNIDKCKDFSYCLTKKDNCVLLIPLKNLINNIDNDTYYFTKLSDEFIRYTRIRQYMFDPYSLLTFSNIEYKLHNNEIILLQSLITQEYFENLNERTTNTFIKNTSYDTANPRTTQKYDNKVSLKQLKQLVKTAPIKEESSDEIEKCTKPYMTKVAGKWNNILPADSFELVFANEPPICSFQCIFAIIHSYNTELMSDKLDNIPQDTTQLKLVLIDIYTKLLEKSEKFKSNIFFYLQKEGKQDLVKQIKKGELSIQDMIINDTYYATALDIWLLADYFNIPIILYSATKFPENNQPLIVAYSNKNNVADIMKDQATDTDKVSDSETDSETNSDIDTQNVDNYYFVKISGVKKNKSPIFKLVVKQKGNALVDINKINVSIREIIDKQISDSEYSTLQSFLMKPKQNFRLQIK